MTTYPKIVFPKAPPIKIQGIKTKLIPFIVSSFQWDGKGRWVEPFLGSGAVLFNALPEKALVADTNEHIINFYRSIQNGKITPSLVKDFLSVEGEELRLRGSEYYYEVRERFNQEKSPLDFLFLNRSCFNGIVRFNSKGRFNVPYCKKDDRFRQAYVTKITNQTKWIAICLQDRDWIFEVQDWRKTLNDVRENDFVYLDPPYVGRHTDYFNSWSDTDADELAETVCELKSGFAYSMWKGNKYRENEHLATWFSSFPTITKSHFYYVGSTETLRNEMQEALVLAKASVPLHTEEREINAEQGTLEFVHA